MKKKSIVKLVFGTFLLGIIGLSSCKKCYKCSYDNKPAIEYCQGVNQTASEFKEYIEDMEDSDYTCR